MAPRRADTTPAYEARMSAAGMARPSHSVSGRRRRSSAKPGRVAVAPRDDVDSANWRQRRRLTCARADCCIITARTRPAQTAPLLPRPGMPGCSGHRNATRTYKGSRWPWGIDVREARRPWGGRGARGLLLVLDNWGSGRPHDPTAVEVRPNSQRWWADSVPNASTLPRLARLDHPNRTSAVSIRWRQR